MDCVQYLSDSSKKEFRSTWQARHPRDAWIGITALDHAHSVHVPCPDGGLPANVSELLAGKGDFIFTGMYSHERGPRAAREWARLNPDVPVRVLRGGFQKLMTHKILAFLGHVRRAHGGGHAARPAFAILEDDNKHVASFASKRGAGGEVHHRIKWLTP